MYQYLAWAGKKKLIFIDYRRYLGSEEYGETQTPCLR